MNLRRGIVRLVRTAAAAFVILLVVLRVFENRLVYHPARTLDANPRLLGRPFEEVFIPVDGPEKIHAWFFPAHAGPVEAADRVILVSHGNGGNISHRLDLAGLLLETGAGVMLYDYEGYGLSSGKPGESRTYRDGEAALRWLEGKGFGAGQIIAYGESLGGAVATELALRQPVGGLILQSTFTSLPDLGAEIYPWLPVRLAASVKYNTVAKLPRIHAPVLVLHSRQDTLIAFHHAERNFAAANSPKSFREIDGDHNDGIYAGRGKFLGAIRDFLGSPATGAAPDRP